jgi:hypothetical protein
MKEGMEKGQSLVMVKRGKLVRVSRKERGSARRRRGEGDAQALLENLTKNKNNSRSIRK